MKKHLPHNLIYFTNGSIGDFLMVLFFLENVHLNAPEMKLIVATPRGEALFKELSGKYPYISIRTVNKTSLASALSWLTGKNLVITPPTPGTFPMGTKVLARLLSLRLGSKLVGFDDGVGFNRFLYGKLLPFDTARLYHDSMLGLLKAIGLQVKKSLPLLEYEPAPEALSSFRLAPDSYIVVHPFGSHPRRSIKFEDLRDLVGMLRMHFPAFKILISGSPQDKEAIPAGLADGESVVEIAGKVSMRELATLIGNAHAYVGVDTGVTHLACMLRKKALVIAHHGTPHWLPFYNDRATILYKVADTEGPSIGRDFLESQRKGRVQYLDRIPFSTIESHLEKALA